MAAILGLTCAPAIVHAQATPASSSTPAATTAATTTTTATTTAATPTETATLPTVAITGTALDTSVVNVDAPVNNGALGQRSVLETPFSSTVVTARDMSDRQINKLGDIFALDASVTDNSAAYGAWTSYLSVRGLPLDWQNSYRIDGNPFLSYVTLLPAEHFEQIDLLKGATAFMYGFGSPGGLINYVTKKPTDEPLRSIDVGYQSKGLLREHVDLGGRIGDSGAIGYRLNATHEAGNTYNDGRLNRNSLSLALDARLTERLTWDFQTLVQNRDVRDQEPTIYAGQLSGNRLPRAVRNDDQTLNSKGQYADNEFRYYSTGLKYALNSDWTFSTNYSYSSTRTRRNESVLFLQNQAGDYDNYLSDYGEAYSYNQWQGMVQGRVHTGPVNHQLVLGASWSKQKNDYSVDGVYFPAGTGNLFRQNTNAYYSDGGLDLYRAAEITQKSLFASDTMDLGGPWSLLAGVRYTDYSQRGFSTTGAETSSYAKNGVPAPTFALMYKFSPRTMAYASYMEALEPGSSVGITYANYGAMLNPLKSKQYELGIKTGQEDWAATAAVFRIEKKSEYTNANNELVQNGESLYQGVELAASRRLGRDWTLGGSLMFLDTEYRKGSDYVGNRVAGAPRWTAAAQIAYAVPALPGLKLRADAKYTGAAMLGASNDVKVGDYTIFNLGATYDTRIYGYDTTFRAGINNLTNKRYWLYQSADYVKAGDPRTFSLSASLKF
nr:TonB-dependent receptor [Bordetella sp. N]